MKSSSNTPRVDSLGLHSAVYFIDVALAKFKLSEFRDAVGDKDGVKSGLSFAPKNPASGEYYVRLQWQLDDKEISAKVEYIAGTKEHAADEIPPFAEDFMEWFGTFFKYPSAETHSHARLRFDREAKRSLFPLPLKTSLRGEPKIDGISLTFPSEPVGISRVRVDMGKKWFVEVVADKKIRFKTFDIHADIGTYMPTLESIMEDTK